MKKNLKINLLVFLFFILIPDAALYYLTNFVFFEGRVQLFRKVVSYSTLTIILLSGIYLFRFNFLFLRKKPTEGKTSAIIFLVLSVMAILYSALLLLVLYGTRNGIGF